MKDHVHAISNSLIEECEKKISEIECFTKRQIAWLLLAENMAIQKVTRLREVELENLSSIEMKLRRHLDLLSYQRPKTHYKTEQSKAKVYPQSWHPLIQERRYIFM